MTAIPPDTLPAAEFPVRHMYRPIELGTNQTHFAIAEIAMPIGGDGWFWSDDNAKILEILSRPELWRRFSIETVEILRFVRTMCHEPLIFRRVRLRTPSGISQRCSPCGSLARCGIHPFRPCDR